VPLQIKLHQAESIHPLWEKIDKSAGRVWAFEATMLSERSWAGICLVPGNQNCTASQAKSEFCM